MIMSGDLIDAQRALQWGLVSEVVEPDALMDRARELAATIASRAPIAAETAKLNLRAAVSMPLDKAVAYERDLQAICFATEDATEGDRKSTRLNSQSLMRTQYAVFYLKKKTPQTTRPSQT